MARERRIMADPGEIDPPDRTAVLDDYLEEHLRAGARSLASIG